MHTTPDSFANATGHRPESVDVSAYEASRVFNREAIRNLSLADQLLFEWFGKGPDVEARYACVHHAFEQYAAAQPDAIAVQHLGNRITYGELNHQANRLAATLVSHGVSTGDAVALFLQRSISMVIGILAVLKAGAAYVPQDAGVAPQTQLRHIINVTSAKMILTLGRLKHLVPVPDGHVCIAIDEYVDEPAADNVDIAAPLSVASDVNADNRCFILFTSGTTGVPNGVQVTHRNVSNILLTEPGSLGMRPGVKVAQMLNIGFDMAAWEILGSLANGATLVIRGEGFAQVAREVDVIISTPSILATLDADQCRTVKVVAVAGEPCPKPLADKWAAFCAFHNSCGPTETTIVNTVQRYDPSAGRLTIGTPTPNNTVYILDEHRKPCAIGEVGEMWAGGDCVTAGYLHNARLTTERYAADPFLGNGRLMFRTRDLGRWTPDGELEHLGRVDDQVKIRGFRVELDSVSAVLESVPSCTHAVALKLDSRNLAAFVCPRSVDTHVARQMVAAALPYYCTPSLIVAMDAFPLTSRGKVDKRVLLNLALERLEEQQRQASPVEESLLYEVRA
ncbi:amino acid adenylation domain-containing protein [Paraburkholderia terricola]|uniref:amino acid adenylation domain-containing protein n=1 Tax=Paraburkholderia terricola TaxID=169427 RepID=UPI003ECDE9A7